MLISHALGEGKKIDSALVRGGWEPLVGRIRSTAGGTSWRSCLCGCVKGGMGCTTVPIGPPQETATTCLSYRVFFARMRSVPNTAFPDEREARKDFLSAERPDGGVRLGTTFILVRCRRAVVLLARFRAPAGLGSHQRRSLEARELVLRATTVSPRRTKASEHPSRQNFSGCAKTPNLHRNRCSSKSWMSVLLSGARALRVSIRPARYVPVPSPRPPHPTRSPGTSARRRSRNGWKSTKDR